MTGKLYGTLGPACANTDTLRALLRAQLACLAGRADNETLTESDKL